LSQAEAPIEAAAEELERRSVNLGLFGRLPPFTQRQLRVFWLVTTAGFFNNYDGALLGLALKQIQQAFKMAEASLGSMLSIIKLGFIPSLLLTPLADRYGRKRLLLYTVVGYTIFTALTALAWNSTSFIAMRFAAIAFSAAEGSVALVILVEEVDAGVRGWAVGLLGALASCGYGVAALVFAFIDYLPYGWRGMYALALLPLAIVIPLRRVLPETRRFETSVRERKSFTGVFRALVREYPARFLALSAAGFLGPLGGVPGGILTAKYLQEAHQWSPGQVSTMYFLGGALGILGNIVAGRLSDRLGRRTMGAVFMMIAPLFGLVFFNAAGPVMIGAWIMQLFCDTASSTIVNAYSAELFPTSYRSTASSALGVVGTLGAATGLLLESALYTIVGSHWRAVSILFVCWFSAGLVILFFFPETAGQELEAISPEQNLAAGE
jgi:putative MFS transporter